MVKNHLKAAAASLAVIVAGQAALANGQGVFTRDVRIPAQPLTGLSMTEGFANEFAELAGVSFQIDYLNENDRRAKSRADASVIGKCNVYYVDEASSAKFTPAAWIAPPLDRDLAEDDFDSGQVALIVESAPLSGISLSPDNPNVSDKVAFGTPRPFAPSRQRCCNKG